MSGRIIEGWREGASRLPSVNLTGGGTPGRLIRVTVFYLMLLVIWHVVAVLELWSPHLFPSPERVWDALWRNAQSGLLFESIVATMQRLSIGYVLSFVIGGFLGIITGSVRLIDETAGTIVLGLQSLPSITWLPLAILWFGLSERAIIFVVLMGSTFSIAISVRDGIRNLSPLLRRAAGTFGASRWQLYRYVLIPGMLPSLAGGLKQGWSFAWRSLMAGELLFHTVGLGNLLHIGRELNNMGMVVAIMLVIIAIGVTVDRLIFGRLEAWVGERWGFAGYVRA